jgi:hypothetical protein
VLQKTLRCKRKTITNAARASKYLEVYKTRVKNLEHFDPDNSLSSRVRAKVFNYKGIPTVSGKGPWSSNSMLRLKKLREPQPSKPYRYDKLKAATAKRDTMFS